MIRWVAFIVGGLVMAVLVAAGTGWLFLGRLDLGPFAASRARAVLGRTVSIAGLHVTPGRWLKVELVGLTVANIPGGARPEMATLRNLTAEVDALSLMHGPAVIRRLDIEGLSVLLERVGGETRNWRFGNAPPKAAKDDRSSFPALLALHVKDSEITVRTSSGHMLQSRIDDGTILTDTVDSPVKLALSGAYHGVPVALDAVLQPIAVLRDAAIPYGMDIHITSSDTTLHFDGTMTRPLDVDGAKGAISLHAPKLTPILAMAGATDDAFKAAVELSGVLTRTDAIWTLAQATGQLNDSALAPSMLRFMDGGHGHPDDVAIDLTFERMDLDRLLAGRNAGKGSGTPLRVEREPDPRLALQLRARTLAYAGNTASDLRLKASVTPGQIMVDDIAAAVFGAQFQASGHADSADKGDRLVAEATVNGIDIQQLRRLTGGSAVPVAGHLDGRASADGAGDTLDAAAAAAHVAAVVWMTSGSISRDVVEKASTDIRALFRAPKGMAAISCALAVFDMHKGVATLSPVRIRAADGTLVGQGVFDLARNQIDVTIGSQSSTTSAFALDVPIRISGNISDPDVRPSPRSVALAAADLTRLPPALRPVVQRNPCWR